MIKTMMDKRHAKRAAFNFWQTLAIGSFGLWMLVIFDDRIADFVTGKEPSNHLQLEDIGFADGMFYQLINPSRGKPKFAFWAAGIWQGQRHICGGNGSDSYRPKSEPVYFSADNWTGDDCSELVVGETYLASATWSYSDRDGKRHELHRSLEFVYSEPVE